MNLRGVRDKDDGLMVVEELGFEIDVEERSTRKG